MRLDYSILIPTYNSKVLSLLVKELHTFFEGLGTYEIIIINDGGTLAKEKIDPPVSIIDFKENYGKNYALFEGLKQAKGDVVITLDDDRQHPVKQIKKLLNFTNYDLVIGQYKSSNARSSDFKHWTEVLLFRKPKSIRFTPFKAFKRSIINISKHQNKVPFMVTILLDATKDIKGVPVEVLSTDSSFSRFSFKKKINFYRNLLASRSTFFQRLFFVKRKQIQLNE